MPDDMEAEDLPDIDEEQFKKLCQFTCIGNIIARYDDVVEDNINKIKKLCAKDDYSQVMSVAHKARGTLNAIYLCYIAGQFEQINDLAKNKNKKAILDRTKIILDRYEKIKPTIKVLAGKYGSN